MLKLVGVMGVVACTVLGVSVAHAAGNGFTKNSSSETNKWRPDPSLPGGKVPHTNQIQYIRGRGEIEKLRLPSKPNGR